MGIQEVQNHRLHTTLNLIHLLSVTAPFGQSSPSPRWLTEHNIARSAKDDRLGVRKDGGNLETSGTFNVHEEAIGALNEAFEFMGLCLLFGAGIQEIDWHFSTNYY